MLLKQLFTKASQSVLTKNIKMASMGLNLTSFMFGSGMRKSTMLKQMLNSDKLEFIMEAHNGLSAKIV